MLNTEDYYEVPGVRKDAQRVIIAAAYWKLTFLTHPDRGGDENVFHMVQDAWSKCVVSSGKRGRDGIGCLLCSSLGRLRVGRESLQWKKCEKCVK